MLGCMVSSSLSIVPALRFAKFCNALDLDGATMTLDINQLDNVTLLDNELESEIENIMLPKEVKEQDLVAGVKDNIVDSESKIYQ